MSLSAMLRVLGCLAFGHAPTVRAVAGESKANYVCGRCGAVLGVFVADADLRRDRPIVDATSGGPAAAIPNGLTTIGTAAGGAGRPAVDRQRDLRESTWLDDGGRKADPAVGTASAGIPGYSSARVGHSCFLIGGNEGTIGAAVLSTMKQR
jgi:hypothetical protein